LAPPSRPLSATLATLFQQKTAEASTDAELQAFVDSIDLLSKIEEA
jgi:hypothetical protein